MQLDSRAVGSEQSTLLYCFMTIHKDAFFATPSVFLVWWLEGCGAHRIATTALRRGTVVQYLVSDESAEGFSSSLLLCDSHTLSLGIFFRLVDGIQFRDIALLQQYRATQKQSIIFYQTTTTGISYYVH